MRLAASCLAAILLLPGAARTEEAPLGIALEGYPYPFPVRMLPLEWETMPGAHEAVRMAYMDVPPTGPSNNRTALLLSGRDLPASAWEGVIRALNGAGWRVIVPDQIGFGKSSKPDGAWSFDAAAADTAALLDKLGAHQVDVVAHSMGAMLAVRFARTYPDRIRHLVLDAPLGLEDYRLTVPPVPRETMLRQEMGLTAEAVLHDIMSNDHPTLPPEQVQPYVTLRERMKGSAEYPRWVASYVSEYYAIWGQPVVHELPLVAAPTLFVVGTRDRAAPGRAYARTEDRDRMGHVAELARVLAPQMKQARVVELDTGHFMQLEQPDAFNRAILDFLR